MLDSCGLRVLPTEGLSGLSELRKLWLSNNGLRQLPEDLGTLRCLESLCALRSARH